jgi:hypothetical protein
MKDVARMIRNHFDGIVASVEIWVGDQRIYMRLSADMHGAKIQTGSRLQQDRVSVPLYEADCLASNAAARQF